MHSCIWLRNSNEETWMNDKFQPGQRVRLSRPINPKDRGITGTVISPQQQFRSSEGKFWLGYQIDWSDGGKSSGASEDRLELAE